METTELSPIYQGHKFADLAEHYEETKDYEKAVLFHKKAAKCFESAIKTTSNKEMQNTLQILYENHSRMADQSIIIEKSNYLKKPFETGSNLDSTQLVESFMLLKQFNELDVNDPFEKFWNNIEELLSKNTNPTLLANYEFDEQQSNDNSNKAVDFENELDNTTNLLDSFFFVPDSFTKGLPLDDHLESNYNIEKHALTKENISLKKKVNELKQRVQSLEKILNENTTCLKSSIHQFKAEVVQRYNQLQSSQTTNFIPSSLVTSSTCKQKLNKSIKPMTQSHLINNISGAKKQTMNKSTFMLTATKNTALGENTQITELNNKIKELTEVVEKKDATIKKYKDRWAQLKLAAKSKRQIKTTPVETKK